MSLLNLEGAYENKLAATGEFNPQTPRTVLTLPSGERLVLPTEILLHALSPALPVDGPELAGEAVPPKSEARPATASATDQREFDRVIPLVAEEMVVSITQVETGRVRLQRQTEEHTQTVSVPLVQVSWEVEHIPVEQVVEAQPEIRKVGETIIFPLVEERLVVKRELWLKEEVHVRKVTNTVEKSADFAVRRDVLVEQRTEATTQP